MSTTPSLPSPGPTDRLPRLWRPSFLVSLLTALMALSPPAVALAAGGPLVNGANHSGVIPIGGLDTWTIQASSKDYLFASVGEVLVGDTDPNFLPRLQLVAPDGTTLSSSYGQDSATVAAQAPSAGTYSVRVYHFTGSGYQQAGPATYMLTVAKTPGPFTISLGDEGGAISNGVFHGTIPIGDVDAWALPANYNDNIMVSIGEVLLSGPDPDFLPRLLLVGPDGTILANAYGPASAMVQVRAPAAGTYTLLVYHFTDSGFQQKATGTYDLTVTGLNGRAAVTYVLPSSAYSLGAGGAEFHTDLRVMNPNPSQVTISASFYDQSTGQTVPASPLVVAPRNQAAFDNVLNSLFGRGLGSYGPIRLEASGPLFVSSSVNNVNACGSGAVSGQWLPGIETSRSLTAGILVQLGLSADPATGYRTNVVFMNPGSQPATVTATLRRGGGSLVGSTTVGPLAGNGFRQVSLASIPGAPGITDSDLYLEFTSNQPILAFASVINNASGDPFAIVAFADVSH